MFTTTPVGQAKTKKRFQILSSTTEYDVEFGPNCSLLLLFDRRANSLPGTKDQVTKTWATSALHMTRITSSSTVVYSLMFSRLPRSAESVFDLVARLLCSLLEVLLNELEELALTVISLAGDASTYLSPALGELEASRAFPAVAHAASRLQQDMLEAIGETTTCRYSIA